MTWSNLMVLPEAYAAFERSDIDSFIALVDPEAEFVSLLMEVEGTTFRGHDGVRDYWDGVLGSLKGWHFDIHEQWEFGDTVLCAAIAQASGESSGLAIGQEFWHVCKMRDGKALWWAFYRGETEALEAVAKVAAPAEASDEASRRLTATSTQD